MTARRDGAGLPAGAAGVEGGAGGERRLVAYVVPQAGRRAAAPGELRAFLRRTLPEFMIPAAYVELAALPLLPNGKVNRAALPEPEAAGTPAGSYVAPRTELERTIAGVLCQVLHVDRVGLADNFFDLGGHSLLMIRAAGTLEQLLGRKLPVLELFRFPTVAALARHLSGEEPAAGATEPPGPPSESAGSGRRQRRELRRQLDEVHRS